MNALIYSAGRPIGTMAGGTFTKRVDPRTHMLYGPPGPGWAIGTDALAQLSALGCETIIIEARDGSASWGAPFPHFMAKAQPCERNAGPQLCLPLADWAVIQRRPLPEPVKVQATAPRVLQPILPGFAS